MVRAAGTNEPNAPTGFPGQPARAEGAQEAIARQAVRARLRAAQLRLTRQRELLAELIFAQGNRHLTASLLFEQAMQAGMSIALATVYNSLRDFAEAGLLAQIGVDGEKTFFDTNLSSHQHFYIEDERALIDVSDRELAFERMPNIPDGYEVSRIDVVVRLRRIGRARVENARSQQGR